MYIVEDGSDLAVIQVDSITDTTVTGPPFTSDLTITIIVPPTTSVSVGADFLSFTGFNNTERTNKTASMSQFQPLMDSLIQDLEDRINDRIARLDAQDVALAANEDPDGTAEIAAQTAFKRRV